MYEMVMDFKRRFPKTIAWRIDKHCNVIEKHLSDDEVIKYAFACQKNHHSYEIFRTFAVAITNERIIIAQKRLLFGYLLISITPDMYNDVTASSAIIWGKICIDTIKEVVVLSNLDKAALPEIQNAITDFVLDNKKTNKQSEAQ